MGRVFVISDLHLGHKSMATHHRNFNDTYYHDEHIISEWNKVVTKRDVVWILGDITMETSFHYYQLDRLIGVKKVILGNHDKPAHIQELLRYVNLVRGTMKYKGMWFSHVPMHPQELYGKTNVHGHIHENHIMAIHPISLSKTKDWRYVNVSAEAVGYKPQLIDDIIIKQKKIYERS